jgi:hypothetical protein
MTDHRITADIRNFYWTRDDRIECVLFAGPSLDKALSIFAV